MDLIWGHISPEPIRCPECENIGLTLWPIQKTSFRFSGHVFGLIWVLNWVGLGWDWVWRDWGLMGLGLGTRA